MAEWLRRQPAKLLGSARTGSNPAGVVSIIIFYIFYIFCASQKLNILRKYENIAICTCIHLFSHPKHIQNNKIFYLFFSHTRIKYIYVCRISLVGQDSWLSPGRDGFESRDASQISKYILFYHIVVCMSDIVRAYMFIITERSMVKIYTALYPMLLHTTICTENIFFYFTHAYPYIHAQIFWIYTRMKILEEGAHLPYNYNGRVNRVIKNKKYFFCVCVYVIYIKYIINGPVV